MATAAGRAAPWRRTISANVGTPAMSSTTTAPKILRQSRSAGGKWKRSLRFLPGVEGRALHLSPLAGRGRMLRSSVRVRGYVWTNGVTTGAPQPPHPSRTCGPRHPPPARREGAESAPPAPPAHGGGRLAKPPTPPLLTDRE